MSIVLLDAVPDLVVPFGFGRAIEEGDDHYGHVVTADASARGSIRCETQFTDIFADLGEVLALVYLKADDIDNLLGRKAVPDTWCSR